MIVGANIYKTPLFSKDRGVLIYSKSVYSLKLLLNGDKNSIPKLEYK